MCVHSYRRAFRGETSQTPVPKAALEFPDSRIPSPSKLSQKRTVYGKKNKKVKTFYFPRVQTTRSVIQPAALKT